MKEESEFNKSEICFIRPCLRQGDYWHNAMKKEGYNTVIPYKDYNLFMRIIREIWFGLDLPKKNLWYNPDIKKNNAKIYFVKDPLMTVDFLLWLRREKKDARILLDFDNRVGANINPDDLQDSSIEKWSYDPDDCYQYNMKLKPNGYFDCYKIKEKKKIVYDIIFEGRDKGRAEKLFQLENTLNELGLKTYFRISPNRSYLKFKKKYYRPVITYTEYLELLAKSRAVLNLMPDGQTAITMRDYEAIFNGIKCITNNSAIKSFRLYHPSRFFIIGIDDINKINDFLEKEFKTISDEELDEYKLDKVIYKMVNTEKEFCDARN